MVPPLHDHPLFRYHVSLFFRNSGDRRQWFSFLWVGNGFSLFLHYIFSFVYILSTLPVRSKNSTHIPYISSHYGLWDFWFRSSGGGGRRIVINIPIARNCKHAVFLRGNTLSGIWGYPPNSPPNGLMPISRLCANRAGKFGLPNLFKDKTPLWIQLSPPSPWFFSTACLADGPNSFFPPPPQVDGSRGRGGSPQNWFLSWKPPLFVVRGGQKFFFAIGSSVGPTFNLQSLGFLSPSPPSRWVEWEGGTHRKIDFCLGNLPCWSLGGGKTFFFAIGSSVGPHIYLEVIGVPRK